MKQVLQRLTTIQSDQNVLQRRGSITIYMSLIILAANIILLMVGVLFLDWAWISTISACVFGLVLAIYLAHKGIVNLGGVLLILVIMINSTAPLIANVSDVYASTFFLSLAIIATSLILPPKYTWFTLIINAGLIVFILYRLNQSAIGDTDGRDILLAALVCNIITTLLAFLSASVLDGFFQRVTNVQTQVQHHSSLLEQQNIALEQRIIDRTQELKTALQQVEQRANEYDNLLAENERQRSIIREMHTPIIPVSDQTLIAPLVGEIDDRHFDQFSSQALQALVATRARYLIIDISGVPFINTKIGQLLLQIVNAAKLLGTEVMLVGMRPDVAHTAVHFGLNSSVTRSFASLQLALNELDYLKQPDTGKMLASLANTTPTTTSDTANTI